MIIKKLSFFLILPTLIALCPVFALGQAVSDSRFISAVQDSAPAGTTIAWSVPTQILSGVTPALEASTATFLNSSNEAVAAILVIKTSGAPYPHDNRRCGAAHAKALFDVLPFSSSVGGNYQMLDLKKGASLTENAVSFIATDRGANLEIESKHMALLYPSVSRGTVWNFQVWTSSFADTQSLLDRLLSALSARVKPLQFSNTATISRPAAIITSAVYSQGQLHVTLNARTIGPFTVNMTIVTWTRPSPTPSVRVIPVQLFNGVQVQSIPWSPANGTDAEVRIDWGGLLDAVLVSVNHTGDALSYWQPFNSSQASAALGTALEFPSSDPADMTSINDSVLNFSGNLARAGEFAGFYADFWPELGGKPAHLSGFKAMTFYAKRTNPSYRATYVLKFELNDGRVLRTTFTAGDVFQLHRIDFDQLASANGASWADAGDRVRRIVVAAEATGSDPLAYGLIFGQLSAEPPLFVSLAVNGSGSINFTGATCTSFCAYPLTKGSAVTLTPVSSGGSQFVGWLGSPECASGTIVPSRNISCNAVFAHSYSLSGLVSYYRSTPTVGNVELNLNSLAPRTGLSTADGKYTIADIKGLAAELSPRKIGSVNNAVTPGDAVYVMQGTAHLQTLTSEQQLAGDVNADGITNLGDAAEILRNSIGLLPRFTAAQACDSDWLFIPNPSAAPNQQISYPSFADGACTKGAISYSPLANAVSGQNFKALLLGDVNGNWKSTKARYLRIGRVRLGRPSAIGPDGTAQIPVTLSSTKLIYSAKIVLKVNIARAASVTVRRQPGIAHLLEVNSSDPARIVIAMSSATPLPVGTILWLDVRPITTVFSRSSVRIDSSASLVEG